MSWKYNRNNRKRYKLHICRIYTVWINLLSFYVHENTPFKQCDRTYWSSHFCISNNLKILYTILDERISFATVQKVNRIKVNLYIIGNYLVLPTKVVNSHKVGMRSKLTWTFLKRKRPLVNWPPIASKH